MDQYLLKYFSINRSLVLPGIGFFYIETKPASLDFVNKTLHAPVTEVMYSNDENSDGETLVRFISKESGLSTTDAAGRFNLFIQQIKQQLETGDVLALQGIGTLSKKDDSYSFTPGLNSQSLFPDLSAERVIRQNAEHNVRVGEHNKTSTEMHIQLAQQEVKEERWWIAAIVLTVTGIAVIAYHYFTT